MYQLPPNDPLLVADRAAKLFESLKRIAADADEAYVKLSDADKARVDAEVDSIAKSASGDSMIITRAVAILERRMDVLEKRHVHAGTPGSHLHELETTRWDDDDKMPRRTVGR